MATPAFPDARRWPALAVLCAGLLLTGIDLTALHVALPALSRALLPGGTELLWIVDSYPLTMATLLLTCGTLADRWGRKRMVLTGFAVFAAASAGAALAADATTLILARVALGAGAATMMAATVGLLRAMFPDDRERGRATGLWTAANSVGAAVGPLVGGALVQRWGWGAVFWINVPIAVAALVAGAILLPESRDPAPRRWDAAGAVLAALGLAAVVVAVKRVAHELGPDVPAVLAAVAGVALLVAFVLRQRRASAPLLDLGLFADRRFGTALISVLVCFAAYAALLFSATQLLQLVAGFSPVRTGLVLVPLAAAAAAGAALGPPLAHRWTHRAALAGSLALFGLSLAGLAVLLGTGPAGAGLLVPLVSGGLGAGAVMALGADLVLAAATPERAAAAGAVQETAFELGSGLGLAVLGSGLAVAYRAGLPSWAGARAEESLAGALAVPHAAALHAVARQAFTGGLAVLAVAVAALLVAVAVLAAIRLRPDAPPYPDPVVSPAAGSRPATRR